MNINERYEAKGMAGELTASDFINMKLGKPPEADRLETLHVLQARAGFLTAGDIIQANVEHLERHDWGTPEGPKKLYAAVRPETLEKLNLSKYVVSLAEVVEEKKATIPVEIIEKVFREFKETREKEKLAQEQKAAAEKEKARLEQIEREKQQRQREQVEQKAEQERVLQRKLESLLDIRSKGISSFRRENYYDAICYLNKVTNDRVIDVDIDKKKLDQAEAGFILGKAYVLHGQPAECLTALETALEKAEDSSFKERVEEFKRTGFVEACYDQALSLARTSEPDWAWNFINHLSSVPSTPEIETRRNYVSGEVFAHKRGFWAFWKIPERNLREAKAYYEQALEIGGDLKIVKKIQEEALPRVNRDLEQYGG